MDLQTLLKKIDDGTATPEDVEAHLAASGAEIRTAVERAVTARAADEARAAPLRGWKLISRALSKADRSAQ